MKKLVSLLSAGLMALSMAFMGCSAGEGSGSSIELKSIQFGGDLEAADEVKTININKKLEFSIELVYSNGTTEELDIEKAIDEETLTFSYDSDYLKWKELNPTSVTGIASTDGDSYKFTAKYKPEGAKSALKCYKKIKVNAAIDPVVTLTGITLDKSNVELTAGSETTFTVTAAYSNKTPATETVKATSYIAASTGIVNVDLEKGVIKALTAGETSVVITYKDSYGTANATITVKVNAAPVATLETLEITNTSKQVSKDGSVTLTAKGTYSDGSTKDVTPDEYTVSDESIAKVENGKLKGLKVGEVTVTAKLGEVKSAAVTFNVVEGSVDPVFTGLKLSKTTMSIVAGNTENFTVTAMYDNKDDETVTTAVTVKSSDETVATVANGVVTAVKAGTATITVSYTTLGETKTATIAVTVTNSVTSIEITNTEVEVEVNSTLKLKANLVYEDGTKVASEAVTYTITDGSDCATLDGSTLQGKKAGTVKVKATLGNISSAEKSFTVKQSPSEDGTLGITIQF